MKTLDEYSAGDIVKLVAATLFLSGMVVYVVWDDISGLPSPEHTTAWRWFGGITGVTSIVMLAHQIHGWRSGALVFDTPEKRANYLAQMREVRSTVSRYRGEIFVVAVMVPISPSVHVALGGGLMGFLVGGWIALIFKSTKMGRAMRAVRREEPRVE